MENSEQQNPQKTLQKLLVFQTTQKYYALIGIRPKLVTQSHRFNKNILMSFLILGSAVISMVVYVFNDAQTLSEYAQSIYMGSFGVLLIFSLTIVILEVEKFFKYIKHCESVVNTSE